MRKKYYFCSHITFLVTRVIQYGMLIWMVCRTRAECHMNCHVRFISYPSIVITRTTLCQRGIRATCMALRLSVCRKSVFYRNSYFLHGDLFLHCVRPITMFNCYFPSVLCPELRTNKISPRHVNRRNVVSLARQRRTLSVINWQLSTVKLKW